MIKRFAPLLGGLNKHFNIVRYFLLAGEITKRKRSQCFFNFFIGIALPFALTIFRVLGLRRSGRWTPHLAAGGS